jgi:hypothetical protein
MRELKGLLCEVESFEGISHNCPLIREGVNTSYYFYHKIRELY